MTDAGEQVLRAGDCAPATRRASATRTISSTAATVDRRRYLEIGNRTDGDNAFYPDDDLMWGEDENGDVRRAQGRPPLLRDTRSGGAA